MERTARRVLGSAHPLARKIETDLQTARATLAGSLCKDGATLDDLREAATMLEETERTARRVLGGAHPTVAQIEESLRNARAALRANEETQP